MKCEKIKSKLKYLMIVNPISGRVNFQQKIKQASRIFDEAGAKLDIEMTQYSGHAIDIARKASRGDYDVIIGAGGDGTINETLNGIIGSDKTLAILPWGTGNVFAREMHIPFDVTRACRIILENNTVKIDLAKMGDRYFYLMCSAGFDAYSVKKAEELNLKRLLGKFTYALGGLKAFSRYSFPEIEVELEDGRKDRGSFVLVSNVSRYAIYFKLTPLAIPVDGLLDVYVFKERGRWNLLKLIGQMLLTAFSPRARKHQTIFFQKQAFYRTKSVTLSSKGNVLTQFDGDLGPALPVTIEVVPQAVNCILPKRYAHKYTKLARLEEDED